MWGANVGCGKCRKRRSNWERKEKATEEFAGKKNTRQELEKGKKRRGEGQGAEKKGG
jgi:hypothetical protein